jgi:hypothetical protein
MDLGQLAALVLLVAAPGLQAAEREWLFEADPYYSSVALQLPLGEESVPDGGALDELAVYRSLWQSRPQIALIEASVYPLPWWGTWYKQHHPGGFAAYDLLSIAGNQINLIEAITAGFQEPWAVSLFVGSAMDFQRKTGEAGNRAYLGYLFSGGTQHIRHNLLIEDPWWEFEWKLKGEQQQTGRTLSWSFRLGTKQHSHPDIADVLYLGLRRSSLDFNAPWLEWLKNSNFEWLSEFNRRNGQFLRQEITVGYKLPNKTFGVAVSLDIGLIYEKREKYTGALADPNADRYTLILRPKLEF